MRKVNYRGENRVPNIKFLHGILIPTDSSFEGIESDLMEEVGQSLIYQTGGRMHHSFTIAKTG